MTFSVPGGSRGIGAGIVLEPLRAGHDVAFGYRSNDAAARLIEAEAAAIRPGCRCQGHALDVSVSDQVAEVADQVLSDLDTVDVVVNCAGINRANLVVSMSDEEWHEVLGTNLHGPFYVVRAFLSQMLASRFGRVINISSTPHNGAAGQANYAARKAGLPGLTQPRAKE